MNDILGKPVFIMNAATHLFLHGRKRQLSSHLPQMLILKKMAIALVDRKECEYLLYPKPIVSRISRWPSMQKLGNIS